MLLLSSILNPLDENCVNTVRMLLKQLRINVSSTGINKIKEHPTYPSMQSVSDMLNEWKIDNVGLRISQEQFFELPLPFIAQLKDLKSDPTFVVVKELGKEQTVISAPLVQRWTVVTTEDFLKQASGYLLLVSPLDNAEEVGYAKKRRLELFAKTVRWTAFGLIFFLAVIAVTNAFSYGIPTGFSFLGLIGLKSFGSYVCSLLLWFEIDQHNPNLLMACRSTRKVNCTSVLTSKASKFMGLSWSEIGSFYFFGSLILLLLPLPSPSSLSVLAWMTLMALPYTVFSVYYQLRIIKQWCVLCLTVQAVLVSEFLLGLVANSYHFDLDVSKDSGLAIGLCFLIPALGWFLVRPLLLKTKENSIHKRALNRLKFQNEVFQTLSLQQKLIVPLKQGVSIQVGPATAKHTILKVCHPYCGHCSAAHTILSDLMQNNPEIRLEIIFMVDPSDDFSTKPVKHFLAIAEKNDPDLIKEVLNGWYSANEKHYEAFAHKYPLTIEHTNLSHRIGAMNQWCQEMDITFTPTIFFNDRQLPGNYQLADLRYFLVN